MTLVSFFVCVCEFVSCFLVLRSVSLSLSTTTILTLASSFFSFLLVAIDRQLGHLPPFAGLCLSFLPSSIVMGGKK